MALALLAICVAAVPAQATTGGASAASGVAAAPVEEAEIAFGPSRLAGASWYGPGLYGRQTACGQTLRASTIGVAHRNLPCGTLVKFIYRGHTVVAPVIDRGPYVKGRAWDLTAAASEALEFEGAGMIRYAVALEYARSGTR
jgi:rare lipoprotein A (peptidoglycan hydrolase)